ncbi:MAG: ferric iron uptake transcriptional regulator [Gammaproteobacteria bacterium]|nr:ferric iron uptake transcriptional regulator [Gammaproteobacteria bacterium]
MDNNDLKKAGLKITLPRLKILELLETVEDRHLSAEDVYKKLLEMEEEVGLATVYRVLTQFETAGLVSRHHFEGGHSVFELNQGTHHDHLVCEQCGKVEEFIEDTIEHCQHKVAEKFGFKMTDHSLYIYGICPKCQKENNLT